MNRYVRVRYVRVRYDSLLYRVLRHKFRHTTDYSRAVKSPLTYGPCDEHSACWATSVLGVLHSLTGLSVRVYARD